MAMHDLITYCADTTALMTEVAKIAPDRIIEDEKGKPVGFSIDKTPTIRAGNETLSVVRVNDEELSVIKGLKSLKILAQVPAGGDLLSAMSSADRAIYDRVYPRTPQPVLDDQGQPVLDASGNPVTIHPPTLIGRFA